MRYEVKKFLFMGVRDDREPFFEQAQELGIIHFTQNAPTKQKETLRDVKDNLLALKILRSLPPVEQEEETDFSLVDTLITKIIFLKQKLEKLEEEKRVNQLEIARINGFGDFSLQELKEIEKGSGWHFQFFFSKKGILNNQPLPEGLFYIHTDHELDYYLSFNNEPKQYPKMVEMNFSHSLGELQNQRKTLNLSIHHTEQILKTYAKYKAFLQHALINKFNTYNLKSAKEGVHWEIEGSLFVLEGWVPKNKIENLLPLVETNHIHMEEIGIGADEVVPTYLENKSLGKLGEDLIQIYDTPSSSDKDPSLWVLFFFSLFFAFIVGDGGYGLVFLGSALFVRYRFTLNSAGKRAWKIIVTLSSACIIWGLLTTSFFGIQVGVENPLRKLSAMDWMVRKKANYLIQMQNEEWKEWIKKYPAHEHIKDPKQFVNQEIASRFSDNLLFELALFIGVLHIFLSMLRYVKRNPVAIGWMIFLVGAYLYFPHYLKVDSLIHFIFGVPWDTEIEGIYLMIGGMAIATGISIFKNRFLGVLEPTTVIQIFGDSMSYLRLYALGVSGAMLSATMLDLAGMTNFVLGGLILIFGHLVNMVLSIMGGTIHGLRLNFLEWYHYSFEGGGKLFNPLRKLKIG